MPQNFSAQCLGGCPQLVHLRLCLFGVCKLAHGHRTTGKGIGQILLSAVQLGRGIMPFGITTGVGHCPGQCLDRVHEFDVFAAHNGHIGLQVSPVCGCRWLNFVVIDVDTTEDALVGAVGIPDDDGQVQRR